jgi:hypothetical protein
LKALFSQATSASFVAKLQGVSNKTSIMNARDELRENVNRPYQSKSMGKIWQSLGHI